MANLVDCQVSTGLVTPTLLWMEIPSNLLVIKTAMMFYNDNFPVFHISELHQMPFTNRYFAI